MITIDQVTVAEKQAEEATQERGAAERKLSENPYSELAALNLTEASKRAAQLGASARELRKAYEDQVEAERAAADRETLEKAAAVDIAAAGKAVESARKALVERIEDAQRALTALMDGAFTYSKVVGDHAAALEAKGLNLAGGHTVHTGGGNNLTGPILRIKGKNYVHVDAGGLAVWVTHRVGAARLPELHPAAGALQFFPGVQAVQQGAEVFGQVAQPKKLAYEAVPSLRSAVAATAAGRKR